MFVFLFFLSEGIVERPKADIVAAEMIKVKRIAPIDSCPFLSEEGTFFLSSNILRPHLAHGYT